MEHPLHKHQLLLVVLVHVSYILLQKNRIFFYISKFKNYSTAFGKPTLGTGVGGGGGFGTFGPPSGLPSLGQQPMLGQPQPTLNPDEQFAESIYNVSIFGDERDIVIAKWNYLQAMWGNGKAFYAKNLPPVEITPQNVRHFLRKYCLL